MRKSLFSALIDRRIVSLEDVVIVENGIRFAPQNSLVFETDEGTIFQLLVSHTQKSFHKCESRSSLQIEGEYESGAEAKTEPSTWNSSSPFWVSSVTEISAGRGNDRRLFGVIFRSKTESTIAICTEGDEAEIMDEDDLMNVSRAALPMCVEVLYSLFSKDVERALQIAETRDRERGSQ